VGPVAQRLTTGWTVRYRIPVGTRISARPDRPWGSRSLLYNGYRVFPGSKVRPGRAADHSPSSNAAVMEEFSYTSTHPLGHIGLVMGSFYLYLLPSRYVQNRPFPSRHTKYEYRQVNKASKTPVVLLATNYLDGKITRSGLSSIGFQLKGEYSEAEATLI